MDKRISLNQFAEYSTKKRDSSKLRIIRQQKNPDPLRLPWYQLAKARMKKSLKNKVDLVPIYDGIEILKKRNPEKKWQQIDKNVSVEALEKYIGLEFPSILKEDLEILRVERSNCQIGGLNIYISPELIFRVKDENGFSTISAVKIHCGKNNSFENKTAKLASVILFNYLETIAEPCDRVEPQNCYIIDVFGNRTVSAPANIEEYIEIVEGLCIEIIHNWDAA